MVIKPGLISASLLALALVSCTSSSGRRSGHLPDWQHQASASVRPMTNWVARPTPTQPQRPAPTNGVAGVPGTAPSSSETTSGWLSLHSWCADRGLPPPLRLTSTTPPSFAVQTAAGNFICRPGSQRAFWNGSEFTLGFGPLLLNNDLFLHSLDLKKTLQVLIRPPASVANGRPPVIVLDPGHGGVDCGTRSVLGGACEKDYVLDWAKRLHQLLVAAGWDVRLTRSTDLDLAISNRVQLAESVKADLFLSLHFNSVPQDQTQDGLETYCLTPSGMPSRLTRGYGDDPNSSFPNNAFDDQNLLLAARVHRALLEVNGNRDRGVRHARFLGVLRGQQRPAILIEGGYLSNPREAGLIADPAYRQKLAEAVAKSLLDSPNHSGDRAEATPPAPAKTGIQSE